MKNIIIDHKQLSASANPSQTPLSLTPRFSKVLSQRNRSQLLQQFLALINPASQHLPSPLKSQISNFQFFSAVPGLFSFFCPYLFACSPLRSLRFQFSPVFVAMWPPANPC
jgi:hypothetical protein